MKGDFSRLLFEPGEHYQAVPLQQGRVLLDSDWNAAWMAAAARRRASLLDVVGFAGAPKDGGGFLIGVDQDQLTIGPGRYYVGGEAVQNDAAVTLATQPFRPALPSSFAAGSYVVYIAVWPRAVDALQDPRIREVALGGPDTTVRLQLVWQVALASVASGSECSAFGASGWTPPGYVAPTGTLQARVEYGTRVGNRLYLVEIHEGGSTPGTSAIAAAQPTFKWSRSNGSVVAGIVSWQADGTTSVVALTPLGPGLEASLRVGDWVEFVDDAVVFQNLAQPLWQVVSVDALGSRATLVSSGPAPLIDPAAHPLLRRWDQQATPQRPLQNGCVAIVPDTWIDLEDDIQVRFAPGAVYATGGFWNFASRSASAGIEWPEVSGQPAALPRFGPYPGFAPLALADYDGTTWSVPSDCRQLFPNLVALGKPTGAPQDASAQIQDLQERVAALEAALNASRKPRR